MGDIADDLIDNAIFNDCFSTAHRAPAPRCRRCGVRCVWSDDKGVWRLYKNGKPHTCAAKADEFEVQPQEKKQ